MSEVIFLQTNQKLKLVPSPGEEEIVPLTFAWLQKLFPLSPFAPSNAILQNSFLVLTLPVFFLKDKMPFWAINKGGETMFKIKYLLGQSTKGAEKDKDKSKK